MLFRKTLTVKKFSIKPRLKTLCISTVYCYVVHKHIYKRHKIWKDTEAPDDTEVIERYDTTDYLQIIFKFLKVDRLRTPIARYFDLLLLVEPSEFLRRELHESEQRVETAETMLRCVLWCNRQITTHKNCIILKDNPLSPRSHSLSNIDFTSINIKLYSLYLHILVPILTLTLLYLYSSGLVLMQVRTNRCSGLGLMHCINFYYSIHYTKH